MREFKRTPNTNMLRLLLQVLDCSPAIFYKPRLGSVDLLTETRLQASTLEQVLRMYLDSKYYSEQELPEDLEILDVEDLYGYQVHWHRGHKFSELLYKYIVISNEKFIVCVEHEESDLVKTSFEIFILDEDYVEIDTPYVYFSNMYLHNPVLSDCDLVQSIRIPDGGTLTIKGLVSITSGCPIIAEGVIKLKGVDSSYLSLINTERCQPCIGGLTQTGLAYGRWRPCTTICREIIVEDTVVACSSVEANFMLGEYGTDNVPKITHTGFGRLDAVECSGIRYRSVKQSRPLGSSGYSNYPEYDIRGGVLN